MPQGRFCDKSFNVVYAGSQVGTVKANIFRPSATIMQDERALHMEWQGSQLTLVSLGGLSAEVTTLFQVTVTNRDDEQFLEGTRGIIRGLDTGVVSRDFGDIAPLSSLSVTLTASGICPDHLLFQVGFTKTARFAPEWSGATVDVAGHSPPPQ